MTTSTQCSQPSRVLYFTTAGQRFEASNDREVIQITLPASLIDAPFVLNVVTRVVRDFFRQYNCVEWKYLGECRPLNDREWEYINKEYINKLEHLLDENKENSDEIIISNNIISLSQKMRNLVNNMWAYVKFLFHTFL